MVTNWLQWKTNRHLPAVWLPVITCLLSLLLVVGCGLYLLSNLSNLLAPTDELGQAGAQIIILLNTVVPLLLLGLNAMLLWGVVSGKRVVLVIAAILLPIEWMAGFVLGGNALTSIFFGGRDLISTMPYHETIQLAALILFAGLSFGVYGKQLYKRSH